jgi:hypothetical protein
MVIKAFLTLLFDPPLKAQKMNQLAEWPQITQIVFAILTGFSIPIC